MTQTQTGQHLIDEKYERRMDEFFAKELGLTR